MSQTDSSEGDSAPVTPSDDCCATTEEVECNITKIMEETSMEETSECAAGDAIQQAEDTPVGQSVAAVPKKPAWGLPSKATNPSSSSTVNTNGKSTPTLSFVEIMNDQSSDRSAARLAYSNNIVDESVSLTEIQAEQERLFASLASEGKQKDQSSTVTHELSGIDEEERKMIELAMKQSLAESNDTTSNNVDGSAISPTSENTAAVGLVAAATTNMSKEEETERAMIEAAIREADAKEQENADTEVIDAKPAAAASKPRAEDIEKEMIEAAIREADAKERADAEAESLKLVMQLQQEEISMVRQRQQVQRNTTMSTGNVRTMTRAEFAAETYSDKNPVLRYDDSGFDSASETGFRMNQQNQNQLSGWYRRDRNTIVGPDNEVRTKHDVKLQGQTNASFLDLDIVDDDTGLRTHVGNTAFNAFRKVAGDYHVKGGHRGTSKGVATHGTGRAGSDADATKGGALDQNVRLQISKAINAGIIEQCNGVVKQGKEAAVYHAVGTERKEAKEDGDISISDLNSINDNDGFDVAIKVFKRIKEFKGRGEYVDGDPRYAGRPFRSFTDREQLELWTEKEYRNLIRAYRAQVPVPNPIHYKDNIIFMRFLGEDGWPAPQIREINIRKGSSKWTALYEQVMGSVRRLFRDARLVHGDLSEYNILIAPNLQVDHKSNNVESENDLQTVLIDFGQAVEIRHPKAEELLRRDLERVREFFSKQGVKTTMSLEDGMRFVIGTHSFSVNMNDCQPYDV